MVLWFKAAFIDLGLDKEGITVDDVGSHSLRAVGAMVLKVNGILVDEQL